MGPGIGVRPLASYGQSAAVPEAPIAADVHEALDVHGHFGAERTLYLEGPFNLLPQKIDFFVAQILSATAGVYPTRVKNFPGSSMPDPIDIGQGYLDSLSPGEVYTRNTCHQIVSAVLGARRQRVLNAGSRLALALLVARIPLTNDPHHSPATNHLAVLTDRFYARSYLHGNIPSPLITELGSITERSQCLKAF